MARLNPLLIGFARDVVGPCRGEAHSFLLGDFLAWSKSLLISTDIITEPPACAWRYIMWFDISAGKKRLYRKKSS
jgi:hypothetical protein